MRLYSIVLFLLVFSFTQSATAQNIAVEEEYSVSRMMARFGELNKMQSTVPGWRIQLVATTDRRKMEATKDEFMKKYPDISIDWQHAKPYYRLRAGAFKTKLEAMRVLDRLKRDYPSAFPAKDANISLKALVGL